MKNRLLFVFLILIIAALLLALGYLLAGEKLGLPAAVKTDSQISAHTVVKEILPVGEYASLVYRYTSVIKDVNSRDINGWNIPFTTRKYIFTYDGVIKLGIDCSLVSVEEPLDKLEEEAELRIIVPSIRILSHEIDDNSIEIFEQSQTIFNQIKIQDAFQVTADRKREMEQKVLAGDAVPEAKASLEKQFGSLIQNLPGIKGKYRVVFIWQEPAPAGVQ